MNWKIFTESPHEYPHGKGCQVFSDNTVLTSEWNKGLKVGVGLYDFGNWKLKVSFKEGKVHKLLEYESLDELTKFTMNQSEYKKEGEIYTEILGDSMITFFFFGKIPIFNGLALKKQEIFYILHQHLEIFHYMDYPLDIIEIRNKNFKYVGDHLNFLPFGKCKINFEQGYLFKGRVIGNYFLGKCKLKVGELMINFESIGGKIQENYKIVSIPLGIDTKISFNSLNYKIYFNSEREKEYLNYLIDVIHTFRRIIYTYIYDETYKKFLSKSTIINSLIVHGSWNNHEYTLLNKELPSDNESNTTSVKTFIDSKCKIRLINEIYEGEVKQGLFNGFGKYIHSTTDIYYGEFKDGQKHGFGILTFSNGNVFRGSFKNGKISGLGFMIKTQFKVKGIWNDNKLIEVLKVYRNS
jgi:hypothetical protein